ncbi:AraC family transcriptional regulator [Viridibacterium curvum]|uniref:HTH araC/xylS-type domain-containing protein n=1 Tax=Viridibacterium curvum TaxID=1101404 RepID=A0ABP9QIB7_9RHOO
MRVTVESFVRQMNSVRRVTDYIGQHIDEDFTLARLADVACLSTSQTDRLYQRKTGETPFTTLRRLRLKRAVEQMRNSNLSLQDIGLAAGYGSQAAFTHAFVRQFGCSPTIARHQPGRAAIARPTTLRLVVLEDQPIMRIPHSGVLSQAWPGVHRMMGELSVAGATRWRTWQTLDLDRPFNATAFDRVDMQFFVPANGQPHGVRNVDHIILPGGLYAMYDCLEIERPRSLQFLLERIERELLCGYTGKHILRREITCNGYTAPQERRIALYVPVYPLHDARLKR